MKLYRIVVRMGSNQGNRMEVHNTFVLYCGYDRLEAMRVYYQSKGEDFGGGPGNKFRETVCQTKNIRETV